MNSINLKNMLDGNFLKIICAMVFGNFIFKYGYSVFDVFYYLFKIIPADERRMGLLWCLDNQSRKRISQSLRADRATVRFTVLITAKLSEPKCDPELGLTNEDNANHDDWNFTEHRIIERFIWLPHPPVFGVDYQLASWPTIVNKIHFNHDEMYWDVQCRSLTLYVKNVQNLDEILKNSDDFVGWTVDSSSDSYKRGIDSVLERQIKWGKYIKVSEK